MRLDKFLCDMGAGTRSEMKKAVRAGEVTVDKVPVRDPGFLLNDPGSHEVALSGNVITYEEFVYYMMNKPGGVLSASSDRHQETVVDLIGERTRTGLFPVGRLDKDTEGLILITNDGQLSHRLLSPKSHVEKRYYAKVRGILTDRDVQAFARGIRYDRDLVAMPAQLKILGVNKEENTSEMETAIFEGKFHQIKKMVEALGGGKEVLYLKRLSMGSLTLDPSLSPGEYRRLTSGEVLLMKDFFH